MFPVNGLLHLADGCHSDLDKLKRHISKIDIMSAS